VGQVAQDFHERALLDLDEKGEDVPFLATPEAMKKLALLMDMERRSFLRVKWAKSFEAPGASALEFHVSPYNVDDIGTIANVVNFLAWQQRQMKPAPNKKWVVVNNSQRDRVKKNLRGSPRFPAIGVFHSDYAQLQQTGSSGCRARSPFRPALA
jgi:hypothetical protein